MITILAPDVDHRSFGRDCRGADDDTGDTNQMGDVGGIQVTDRDMRCGRMQEQLV